MVWPKATNQDCGHLGRPGKLIRFPGRNKDLSFWFTQKKRLACKALQPCRMECTDEFLRRTREHFDLNGGACVAETSSPSPCDGLRMQVAHD